MDTTPGQLTRDGKTAATFNVPGTRRHPPRGTGRLRPARGLDRAPRRRLPDAQAATGGRGGVR
ncbi:hypothetical protein GCM10023205_25190 [Yinghuangia aomiensis]|uniref:Uncharacterized protein n=1 Tax=Yinghuangia aomiensis TaxID=676205 RepID=A0ABP9H6B1_9ACTN